jgi:hypothetical protein
MGGCTPSPLNQKNPTRNNKYTKEAHKVCWGRDLNLGSPEEPTGISLKIKFNVFFKP